jgi:hypothetical protein
MIQIQIDISIEPDMKTTKMSGVVLQAGNATRKEVCLGNELLAALQATA